MPSSIVTSVMLNTVAHFWRVMEKSGMTPKHVQRVIERPKLRDAIIALIEADMVKLWRPADNPSRVPTNLAHWTDPFDQVFDHDDDNRPVPLKPRLDALIEGLESKVSAQEVAEKVFCNGRMRDPLLFLYHYGLIGDRPVSIEELASGYDITSATVNKRLTKFRYQLRNIVTQLLHQDYAPLRLLQAGLVTPEWAVSTDDMGVLCLSRNTLGLIEGVIRGSGTDPRRFFRISQLTALSEVSFDDELQYWTFNGQDPIEEIKTALAKFGLSLAESVPSGE